MLSSKRAQLKRKLKSNDPLSVRKRSKRESLAVNDLPWKTVVRPSEAGVEDDDGILMLEEVDGVEVVYEDTAAGRVAKFNVRSTKDRKPDVMEEVLQVNRPDDLSDQEEEGAGDANVPSSSRISQIRNEVIEVPEDEPFETEKYLPNWLPYPLHPRLLASLHRQNFISPTPIQAQALPVALNGKDVIGVAQTGSGKTLAYGLPILHDLLSSSDRTHPKDRKPELKALILAPTRELALQVSSHLKACIQADSEPGVEEYAKADAKVKAPKSVGKAPPRISVAAIVGGMSAQKQRRVLDRGVDVLVATPGRLWDLLGEDDVLAKQLKNLKFLVLDEADRMIEAGHFAELDNIVRLTLRQSQDTMVDSGFAPPGQGAEDADADVESVHDENEEGKESRELQTFVFSATLSKDLQQNLKKRSRLNKAGRQRDKKTASTLDELLMKLDFRDEDPEVIDLSPVGGAVSTLKESRVECLSADKDVYLYYFLLRYPGRSLVFLSSIDGIRRLTPIMELLQLNAFPLHSQLQQKQRLKNLDRFKSTLNSILLATDIAARGLDIPAVDHVIHYQIPRSADGYIHRNGRTARAMRDGFSLLMCAPDEKRLVRGLLGSLGRVATHEIPDMPIELDLLDKMKSRVQLARKIDAMQHKIKKEKHEKNWLKETADAMEIELDLDFADASDDESSKRKDKARDIKTASLKAELKQLLSQPLIARGISKKYITSGTRDIVHELLDGSHHEGMLGFKQGDARSDLVPVKSKKKGKQKQKVEEEEWTGCGS